MVNNMAPSPAKRRKLSPEPPGSSRSDAPATPSRIPGPPNTSRASARRPSFASPTRASIARHNPQILERRASAANNASAAREITNAPHGESLFVTQSTQDTLDENAPESTGGGRDTGGPESLDRRGHSQTPLTPKKTATARGGMASAPRRRSQSPQKQDPKAAAEANRPAPAAQPDEPSNPFAKRGLRRSPPSAAPPPEIPLPQESSATAQPVEDPTETGRNQEEMQPAELSNPFKKGGLRRSDPKVTGAEDLRPEEPVEGLGGLHQSGPVSAEQPSSAPQEENSRLGGPAEPSHPVRKGGLRRSDSLSANRTDTAQVEASRQGESAQTSNIENVRQPAPASTGQPENATEVDTARKDKPAKPSNNEGQSRPSENFTEPGPVASHQRENATREEPELPPTPTQRGIPDPIVTTPPPGIHNTPSKRRKRHRDSHPGPSPLRLRDARPAEPAKHTEPATEEEPRFAKRRREEPASRHVVPVDPHAEKKKQRARLLAEAEQLEADIRLAERENERIHKYHQSGRGEPKLPSNADAIIDLLVRSSQPAPPANLPAKPPTIFQRIGLFLPFSKRPRPRPPVMPVDDEKLPSHLPVKLENPLPYLQLFTPLTFSSTTTLIPPTPGEDDGPAEMLQLHSISISAPTGLFHARVSMVVNAMTLSVTRVHLDRLDPNAEAELGPWVRQRAESTGPLGRDVNAIHWAMGQWFESALRRARFWCAVEAEMGSEEGRKRIKKRMAVWDRRKHASTEGWEEEGETARKWTRRELLPQMKRRSLVMAVEGVEVTLEWHIGFDWTGEAEQRISASARVLKSCKSTSPNSILCWCCILTFSRARTG